MGWLYVLLAAGCELIGVTGLTKYSKEKTFISFMLYFGGFGFSFYFLYQSFMFLQVSTAYAVWIGIGTAGAVVINMLFFNESKNFAKIVSVILIVIGVVGLKYVS